LLGSPVLVLNRHFQALRVASVKRAFALLSTGHAKVVTHDYDLVDWNGWVAKAPSAEDDVVTTPRLRIVVPRVIAIVTCERSPRIELRFSRRNVYLRDEHRCQYCSHRKPASELSLDHVLPISRGGKTTWENVVAACRPCNVRKADRTPHEAGLRLLRPPSRPRVHPFAGSPFGPALRPEWKPFVASL
jgi:5-methylcytosine-specific restriction endonuclease McrA